MITSLGDGQIPRIDHDVALPGEDSNKNRLGGRERQTEAGHAGGEDMSV